MNITEKQLESLEQKIYETLILNPDVGLGELGECRDEAKRIVKEWVEENPSTETKEDNEKH